MTQDKEYLEAAAAAVDRETMENPGVPIPVDPDEAEKKGALEDDAKSYEDALESGLPVEGAV